jgi:hypothetical protein
MGPAKHKGLVVKGLDTVGIVAGVARFNGEVVVDIIGIPGFHMKTSGPVAHLAPSILEVRGLGFRDKAAGFAITRGVTLKAFFVLGVGELWPHDPDTLKGGGFLGKRHIV